MAEAQAAALRHEVPVGAVLVEQGSGLILARDGNRVETLADPTAHAEMLVLRAAAAASGRPRLPGTTLYVSLEPCAQCAAALSLARVSRLVFAADDPKGGAVLHGPRWFAQPTCHHKPDVVHEGGAVGVEAGNLLRSFFQARRKG